MLLLNDLNRSGRIFGTYKNQVKNTVKNGVGINANTSARKTFEEAGVQGLRVLSIALLTNYAAGIGKDILSHKDVIEVASQSKIKLMNLLSGVIKGVKE